MQFKSPNTKNFRKLKEISRTKRCQICHHRLKNTGVFVWSKARQDAHSIKCVNCLTVYSTDFGILDLGIPSSIGYS